MSAHGIACDWWIVPLGSRGCSCGRAAIIANSRAFDASAPDALRAFSDDQLRGECKRRDVWAELTLDSIPDDIVRDEFIKRGLVDRVVAEAQGRHVARLEAERDEWKRRAEAAEETARMTKMCAVDIMSRHGLLQPDAVRNVLLCEGGPGIAAKPPQSEPLAFLDEDLFCEDA